MNENDWRFKGFGDTRGSYTGQSTKTFYTPPTVNAASRIPNPSGTDWAATFGRNAPQSPSGTDIDKQFANGPLGKIFQEQGFQFNLFPSRDQSQLQIPLFTPSRGLGDSISTPTTDFYKERVANMDLTKRDHELYGAGEDFGFLD